MCSLGAGGEEEVLCGGRKSQGFIGVVWSYSVVVEIVAEIKGDGSSFVALRGGSSLKPPGPMVAETVAGQ